MDGFMRYEIIVRNPVINPAFLVLRVTTDSTSMTPIYADARGGPGALFQLDPEPKFEPKVPISADAKTMRRKAYELEQMEDRLSEIHPANTKGTLAKMLVQIGLAMSCSRVVRPMIVKYKYGAYETVVIEPVRDSRYLASETHELALGDDLIKLCNDVEAIAWSAARDIVAGSKGAVEAGRT